MNQDTCSRGRIRQAFVHLSQYRSVLRKHREPLFVWSIFVLGCVALFYHTYYSTRVFPAGDEWFVFDSLTGEQPITLNWLWSQHNEHRIFLPRLMLKFISWHSNLNEKSMTAWLAALGCASAFLVVLGLRTVRGRVSYLDIIPAATLLHWGHTNYRYTFQLALVLPAFIFLLLVFSTILSLDKFKKLGTLVAGIALVALPLSGGCMLPAACLFAPYFVYRAWKTCFREKEKLFAFVIAFFPLATCALVILYFVDFHPIRYHTASPGLGASFLGGLGILSNAFGVFPPICIYLGLLLLIASLVVSVGLVSKAIRDRGHRDKCIVLLLAGLSVVGLAFCIGHSRIGLSYPTMCLGTRYIVFMAPLLFILWAGFSVIHPRRTIPSLQVFLACIVLLTMGVNYREGYQRMQAVQRRNRQILIDAHLMDKRDAEFFASKYWFRPPNHIVVPAIDKLSERNLGVFSPEVRLAFRKSLLPYFQKKTRLEVLRSWMNKNRAPEKEIMSFDRDGVTGWSLFALAPSRAVLDAPPQASTIKVEFGVYPKAYELPRKPDVKFQISIKHGNGRVETIWSRCLIPDEVVKDRGVQQATIELPSREPGAKLVVETLEGEVGRPNWAYWSDFQILGTKTNAEGHRIVRRP